MCPSHVPYISYDQKRHLHIVALGAHELFIFPRLFIVKTWEVGLTMLHGWPLNESGTSADCMPVHVIAQRVHIRDKVRKHFHFYVRYQIRVRCRLFWFIYWAELISVLWGRWGRLGNGGHKSKGQFREHLLPLYCCERRYNSSNSVRMYLRNRSIYILFNKIIYILRNEHARELSRASFVENYGRVHRFSYVWVREIHFAWKWVTRSGKPRKIHGHGNNDDEPFVFFNGSPNKSVQRWRNDGIDPP